MLDWTAVDDISSSKDGSALKRVLAKGEGWQRAEERYECRIDVRVLPTMGEDFTAEGKEAVFAREGMQLVPNAVQPELRDALCGACGDADVAGALALLLRHMQKGERALCKCTAALLHQSAAPPGGGAAGGVEGGAVAGGAPAIGSGLQPALGALEKAIAEERGGTEGAATVDAAEAGLLLDVTLHSWVVVSEVRGTRGQVRELLEASSGTL